MPKVTEILIKRVYKEQIWYDYDKMGETHEKIPRRQGRDIGEPLSRGNSEGTDVPI